MDLVYEVVDVFTDRAFAGNPLAVVLDADALTTAELQALAREFNLSETAFPMAADQPGTDYRLRIFTPERELPFAGHPSVGAAWLMARLGRVPPGRVVQSCGAGLLPLEVAADGGPVTLTGGTPSVGDPLDGEPLLAAVGLFADDLAGVPRIAGCGLTFGYLPVRAGAVQRAVLDVPAVRRLGLGGGGLSIASWDGTTAHTRVFAVDAGVPEDPATGSAALGYGVWLVASGLVAGVGTTQYTVVQGVEMGRPSQLQCVVEAQAGAAVQVRVTGAVVPVARGRIRRPA
jgi:trans-2,3-dihydro-3-hydroxyanthranilate isomerase